jgi:Right handed beta helix region
VARRATVVVAVTIATLALSPAASAACARFASERGSDRAAGTAGKPFRTVTRLLRALPTGATGCLVGGSAFKERVFLLRPATLRSVGGRATILGGVVVTRGARGATVRGLAIRGGGRSRAAVLVQADRARIVANDISGRYVDRAAPCVLLEGVSGVVVDGNRVHDCTRVRRFNPYSAGIVVASAVRARVSHNLVFHTHGDGIVLAPNAQRTRVTRNVVDGNPGGVYIGGGAHTASSHNLVTRNVISNSGRWNVHASWPGPRGGGNVVVSNCLWNGFAGNVSGTGFAAVDNLVARPRFVDRPADYAMRSGPCLPMHPRIVEARVAPLRQFRIAYRLRALAGRVQVMELTLRGVNRGARVDVRCLRGCRASWRGRARTPTFELPVLRGAWLLRGAVVEVRARKPFRAGHYARLTVVGLPGGVRVVHACMPPARSKPVSCSLYRRA